MSEKNLWECVVDSELIEFMRLVGCDEKYINGNASDYECFAELCRVFCFFSGSEVSRRFIKNVNEVFGGDVRESDVISANASDLWRGYNDNEHRWIHLRENTVKAEKDGCSRLFECGEKSKNIFQLNEFIEHVIKTDICSLNDLVKYVENKLKIQHNDNIISVSLCMKNDMFVRPDRYHAQMVIDSKKRGENCNNEQNDTLLCQAVCDLLCSDKDRRYELHISGNSRAIGDFAEYLTQYNMGARIYALCEPNLPCGDILDMCRRSTVRCRITPEFIVSNNVNKERIDEYLQKLSLLYPIGAVTFR